jgi:hypothetical protein
VVEVVVVSGRVVVGVVVGLVVGVAVPGPPVVVGVVVGLVGVAVPGPPVVVGVVVGLVVGVAVPGPPVVTVVNGPAVGGFDLSLLDAASMMAITPNTTSTTKLAISSAACRRLGSGPVGEGVLSMPPSPACRADAQQP